MTTCANPICGVTVRRLGTRCRMCGQYFRRTQTDRSALKKHLRSAGRILNDPRCEPIPETGCIVFLWSANRKYANGGDDYVRVNWEGKRVLAHRLSWEQERGAVPTGLVLDHTCRVRSCINPDHLRVVTNKENILAPGAMSPPAINSRKEKCGVCDGPFSLSLNRTRRYCKPCERKRVRDWKRINRKLRRQNA